MDKKQEELSEQEFDEIDSEAERYILCAQCRQVITTPSDRVEVNGMHQHTFFNPYGIIFQIGCYKTAIGCRYVGPSTDEFSWFPGYSWRIAVCKTCQAHVGWLYTSVSTDGFHGLIMDHLIQPD